MQKNNLITGVLLGLSLVIAGGRVEAKEKQFHATFTGTTTNKDDFSFTGTQADYFVLIAGKSTLGHYTAQLIAEIPPDGKACPLPNGSSGIEFITVGEVIVLSFPATGDQLFLRLSANVTSHACFDLATSTTTGQTTFDVSGGTGRFEGATGSLVKTWKNIILAFPANPPGKGAFASFTGAFDGTIELAK